MCDFTTIPGWQEFANDKSLRRRPAYWVQVAEELTAANGGVLRSQKWLEENGYEQIAQAKRKHPELFKHLKQDRFQKRSLDEWVKITEELVTKYGAIPDSTFLTNNGLTRLNQVMGQFPKRFKHLQQIRKYKTKKQWIEVYMDIVKKHGHPKAGWLARNNRALYMAVRKYPDIVRSAVRYLRAAAGNNRPRRTQTRRTQ